MAGMKGRGGSGPRGGAQATRLETTFRIVPGFGCGVKCGECRGTASGVVMAAGLQ